MSVNSSVLEAFDESKLNSFHWKTILTAGMGFFTDAYDLFIIGTVTAILTPMWHLTTTQLSILNSTSLAAAALGALFFGKLMDLLGRKAMYGIEVAMLAVGAILSACAPSFIWLVIFRFIVGLGVGGDYPTSSVIMTEYANRKNRGFLVTMVFAMQGLGLLAGPLVASLLLSIGIPHAIAWRLMLGLGAIPAASVIYLRRKMPETPRYLLAVKQDANQAASVASHLTGQRVGGGSWNGKVAKQSMWSRKHVVRLIGTAGSWFLIDVAFYGNSVSSQLILKALLPHAALVTTTLVATAIFLVAAVPGYFVAAGLMDKIGRKTIQSVGFVVMACAYAAIFLVPSIAKLPLVFLIVYAISYFFIEFGPNTTTFLVPSEVFPTNLRGTAHGMSAAGGKIGAFLGAFILPGILKASGLNVTMGMLAGVALLGAILTLAAVPEMKQRSLEDNEEMQPSAASASPRHSVS
ncbi:sugar phosphate permease [Alicyclobacillus sacchari]|uniref:Sugar phosphate permease n=1 Tax=Alicyclobacillus sacchari TaxID=392010 RepID=A0A4R8LVP4_9BACL|nr:MFS transporter [Alicyclobacillus sacchari]TDY51222.1 sugar phosphate permease [Alicyclobacillus sacchari]